MASVKTGRSFWLVASLSLLGLVNVQAQDMPVVSREKLYAASSAELTEGYLNSWYQMMAAAQAVNSRETIIIDRFGISLSISSENAQKFLRIFAEEFKLYMEAVKARGFRQLSQAWIVSTTDDCSRFGFEAGPALIDQHGSEIELSQNGVSHRGVIVESAMAFEHANSSEVRLVGEVKDDQIRLRIKLSGFAATGQPAGCALELQKPEKIEQEFAMAFFDRAFAHLVENDLVSAISDLDQAIDLDPKLAAAFSLRAQLRSSATSRKIRDGKLAIDDAKRACDLTGWNNWQCVAPLASAYAEAGDFDSAIKWINKAIELAPEEQLPDLKFALEKFTNKRPLRIPFKLLGATPTQDEPDWANVPETPGGTLVAVSKVIEGISAWSLKLSGFHGDKKLELWTQNLGQAPQRMGNVLVDEHGLVMLPSEEGNAVFMLAPAGFVPGERLLLTLVSEDRHFKASTRFAPNPLAVDDPKTGYGLDAELVDPTGVYLVELKGFDSEQEVRSYGTQLDGGKEVDFGKIEIKGESGRPPAFVVAPGVYGKSGGIVALRVVGKKGQIVLEVPWGDKIEPARVTDPGKTSAGKK